MPLDSCIPAEPPVVEASHCIGHATHKAHADVRHAYADEWELSFRHLQIDVEHRLLKFEELLAADLARARAGATAQPSHTGRLVRNALVAASRLWETFHEVYSDLWDALDDACDEAEALSCATPAATARELRAQQAALRTLADAAVARRSRTFAEHNAALERMLEDALMPLA